MHFGAIRSRRHELAVPDLNSSDFCFIASSCLLTQPSSKALRVVYMGSSSFYPHNCSVSYCSFSWELAMRLQGTADIWTQGFLVQAQLCYQPNHSSCLGQMLRVRFGWFITCVGYSANANWKAVGRMIISCFSSSSNIRSICKVVSVCTMLGRVEKEKQDRSLLQAGDVQQFDKENHRGRNVWGRGGGGAARGCTS